MVYILSLKFFQEEYFDMYSRDLLPESMMQRRNSSSGCKVSVSQLDLVRLSNVSMAEKDITQD